MDRDRLLQLTGLRPEAAEKCLAANHNDFRTALASLVQAVGQGKVKIEDEGLFLDPHQLQEPSVVEEINQLLHSTYKSVEALSRQTGATEQQCWAELRRHSWELEGARSPFFVNVGAPTFSVSENSPKPRALEWGHPPVPSAVKAVATPAWAFPIAETPVLRRGGIPPSNNVVGPQIGRKVSLAATAQGESTPIAALPVEVLALIFEWIRARRGQWLHLRRVSHKWRDAVLWLTELEFSRQITEGGEWAPRGKQGMWIRPILCNLAHFSSAVLETLRVVDLAPQFSPGLRCFRILALLSESCSSATAGALPKLNALKLRNMVLSDFEAALIGTINGLETAHVMKFRATVVDYWLKALSATANLRELRLMHCDFLFDEALLQAESLKTIECLELSDCRLLTDSLLTSFVANLVQLRELNVSGCANLTPSVVRDWKVNTILESVDFSRCGIASETVRDISVKLPNLKHLNLLHCHRLDNNCLQSIRTTATRVTWLE